MNYHFCASPHESKQDVTKQAATKRLVKVGEGSEGPRGIMSPADVMARRWKMQYVLHADLAL